MGRRPRSSLRRKKTIKPHNLPEIWESCERYRRGSAGNFASVLFTGIEESIDPRAEENGNIAPLYGGKEADWRFRRDGRWLLKGKGIGLEDSMYMQDLGVLSCTNAL